MRSDHYDDFADVYERENSGSLLNAHYERPAILRLAGDVTGRRVLDAGCGSGPLAAELAARGAEVSGFDGSPAMIEIARRRLGDDVDLRVADLAPPLPYEDAAFDDVIASLVLHYLPDWSGALNEVRRVLRPGGRLVVSVNHPSVRLVNSMLASGDEDYFATYQYTEDVEFDGVPSQLTMWHRPLRDMTAAFTDAGFGIRAIEEPAPSPDTPADLMPPRIAAGERSAFLCFLFFVLQAP